jgi:hypothetical protein
MVSSIQRGADVQEMTSSIAMSIFFIENAVTGIIGVFIRTPSEPFNRQGSAVSLHPPWQNSRPRLEMKV